MRATESALGLESEDARSRRSSALAILFVGLATYETFRSESRQQRRED